MAQLIQHLTTEQEYLQFTKLQGTVLIEATSSKPATVHYAAVLPGVSQDRPHFQCRRVDWSLVKTHLETLGVQHVPSFVCFKDGNHCDTCHLTGETPFDAIRKVCNWADNA